MDWTKITLDGTLCGVFSVVMAGLALIWLWWAIRPEDD